tara:strand:+ start:22 stop:471 length:450 start_codon:yes stop_codon:yes gene_type:complete
MTKRGSITYVLIVIIILILALVVFLTIPMIAQSYASGKIALKVAAAKDIALILDTIYSYPYDTELRYDVDLSDFKVDIFNNTVKIYEKSYGSPGADPKLAQYSFVPVNDILGFTLEKPKSIEFKKENGKITCVYIKEDQEGHLNVINCK